jgi:restriction system protein
MKNYKVAEYIQWFGPVLDALRELGGSGSPQEVIEKVAKLKNISDEKREEILKNGTSKFDNQVRWARQYLMWEGLIDNSKRGIWILTPNGQKTHLTEKESHNIVLKRTKLNKKTKINDSSTDNTEIIKTEDNPERIESSSLLDVLKTIDPIEFEHLCKMLLREHGFENVEVTQITKDDGIDGYGTLKINPFISMRVIFQCKRYKKIVSRVHVGDFRNAVMGRADKGIIITTGTFSEDAKREASRDGVIPIELIDGQKLVELFEQVELGVKAKTIYEIDYQFFDQFNFKK